MAVKEARVVEVRERLEDITKCYVCSKTYEDPKLLQCMHTFCMKCLEDTGNKTGKSSGDQMPCPMCRKEFAIPKMGYPSLETNRFVEKLIQMAKSSDLCETCMEKSESTSEIPLAELYCIECQLKLCQKCNENHRKYKLTRNHCVVAVVDSQGSEQILAPSSCEKHKSEHLLYCSDCKELLCNSCFGEGHQNHRLQNVKNAVESFKNEIQNCLGSLEVCETEVYKKKEFLNLEKDEYCENLENLKPKVLAQKDAAIKLVSKHTGLLMQEIELLKAQKLQEVRDEIKDTERYLTCVESLKVYCTAVMMKGSASDICYTLDKLKPRAEEIKEQHEPKVEIRSSLPKTSFRISDLEEFLKTEDYNIIGNIEGWQMEAEGEVETRTSSNKASLDGDTKMEDECVMPVPSSNGILAKIKKLNRELESERRRVRELEVGKKAFETRINELELQLGIKRPKYTSGLLTAQASVTVPIVPQVPREISFDYRKTPTLLMILQSLESGRSANGDKIRGFAILDDELFLGSCTTGSVIEVYDIKRFMFKRRWRIETNMVTGCPTNMGDPRISCMASCSRYKCLYVCVYSLGDISGCRIMWRSDAYGSNVKEWKIDVGHLVLNLSVTGEGNVVVTNSNKNTLLEYSRDGELVREVKLSWNLAIERPLHALKLANGNFLLSHCLGSDRLRRVLIVSESGQIAKSYGAMSKPLTEPVFLAVDQSGNVLVADRGNNSILVLNSDLEFVACINPYCPLQKPNCVCIGTNEWVFVCENQKKISVYGSK